jgi:acetolactate synthase small subunit
VWLMMNEDSRMDQIVRQVRKLHDVLDIRVEETDKNTFERLNACLLTTPGLTRWARGSCAVRMNAVRNDDEMPQLLSASRSARPVRG